jgi:hypothetical protein
MLHKYSAIGDVSIRVPHLNNAPGYAPRCSTDRTCPNSHWFVGSRRMVPGAPGSVAATEGMPPGCCVIGDVCALDRLRPGGTLTAVNCVCDISSVCISGSRTVNTGGHASSAVSRMTVALTTLPEPSGSVSITSEPLGRYGASCGAAASAVEVLVVMIADVGVVFTMRPS